jgi:GWxTD domain-containing protein
MNRILRFAVAICVAVPMFAADLGKYSKWADSAQGYFLTREERKQWEGVANEAAAEKFVSEFVTRRAPDFATEVAKRVEMADKYLTLGNRPGSQTLRGKVIVLFGPPSAMDVAKREKTTTKRDNPIMADALSNAGSTGGGRSSSDSASTLGGGSISTSTGIRSFTITFTGDSVVKTIDKPSVTFVIDADAATGKDEFPTRSAAKEADESFELAARASIVKK